MRKISLCCYFHFNMFVSGYLVTVYTDRFLSEWSQSRSVRTSHKWDANVSWCTSGMHVPTARKRVPSKVSYGTVVSYSPASTNFHSVLLHWSHKNNDVAFIVSLSPSSSPASSSGDRLGQVSAIVPWCMFSVPLQCSTASGLARFFCLWCGWNISCLMVR